MPCTEAWRQNPLLLPKLLTRYGTLVAKPILRGRAHKECREWRLGGAVSCSSQSISKHVATYRYLSGAAQRRASVADL